MNRIVVIIFFVFMNASFADDCIEVRAAFDVGSGTTKMKVAKVNKCLQKIVKVLKEENRLVGYKQSLGDRKEFPKEIILKGISALKELKKIASEFKPVKYIAVATSAFRKINNAENVLTLIRKETGIELKIITQEEEAKIGYFGGVAKAKTSIGNVLVWDIGGGSMQMVSLINKKLSIYTGQTASVTFKNKIIKEIQNKDPVTVISPNPIGKENINSIIKLSHSVANKGLSKSFKDKLANPKTEILGIGGVHYYSLKKQLATKEFYTYDQLKRKIKLGVELKDSEIKSKYKSTEISNLLLVAGFMQALKIKKVYPVQVNLTDGLLLR